MQFMRSILFVPSKAAMLSKINTLDADAYILDLEDSIAPDMKPQALKDASGFLETCPEQRIYIRLDRAFLAEQAEILRAYSFDGYMLPKFERLEDFAECEQEFSRRSNIALVETPAGMVNLKEIAGCSWVKAIAFGAEDYTAAVNMENRAEYLTGIKSRIVMFAKAFGKYAVDTPFMNLKDNAKFLEEANISADMGFDGKMAVHPKQCQVINEVFMRRNNPDFMREVIRRYEESGGGAVSIGGKIYEQMHIARFRKILEQEGM